MSEVFVDLVEDILKRLDGEDLIRCKSVCKSWLSLISSCCFVKTHLDYNKMKDDNNDEIGHRRIIMPSSYGTPNDTWYIMDLWHIIGSSNGLVCVSPKDAQLLVTNPLTREVKELQPGPQIIVNRHLLCWGFGHDSSTDDYKVVMGIKMRKVGTLFHVLSLKSNTWKAISLVKYKFYASSTRFGILWNGALHWFMKDYNTKRMVILSFNLSTEEFNECPQPDDSRYVSDYFSKLGILKKCLCIFRNDPPYQRWVMKTYNDKYSWEPLPYDCEMSKYDVAHTLKCDTPQSVCCFCDDKGMCLPKIRDYIGAPIFVKSIVSPHVNRKPKKKRKPSNDIKSLKALSDYDVKSRSFCWQTKNRKMNVAAETFQMEMENTEPLRKRTKFVEEKELTAEDGALVEVAEEETEANPPVSEQMEAHMSQILEKIDNFTQQVSEFLESGKSFFKDLSNEFEERVIAIHKEKMEKWQEEIKELRFIDASNEEINAVLQNAQQVLYTVHNDP